jgi:hypothetical protein
MWVTVACDTQFREISAFNNVVQDVGLSKLADLCGNGAEGALREEDNRIELLEPKAGEPRRTVSGRCSTGGQGPYRLVLFVGMRARMPGPKVQASRWIGWLCCRMLRIRRRSDPSAVAR